MRMSLRFASLVAAASLALVGARWRSRPPPQRRGSAVSSSASLLFDETRYREALDAFDRRSRRRSRAGAARPQGQGPRGAAHRRVRRRPPRGRNAHARRRANATPKRSRSTATRCGRPGCSTRRIAPIAMRWRSAPESSRARFGDARSLAATQPAGRGARRRAGRVGGLAARRRDLRAHRRDLRAAESLRGGGQRLHATTSTCCRTRTAARRRPGRAPRWSSSSRSSGVDAGGHRRAGPQHAAHAAVQAGEGQDRRAGAGQRRPAAGLHAGHRLRGDGDLARDGAARAHPADHLHAQRRRRRGRAARPAAGAARSRSSSARCRCATCRCSSRTRRCAAFRSAKARASRRCRSACR